MLSKLDLPPIQEFLPPPDKTIMPVNDMLTKAGLPTWEELGLPSIYEFMRPVGSPRNIMGKLPSRGEVAKLANETLSQVRGAASRAGAAAAAPAVASAKVLPAPCFPLPCLPLQQQQQLLHKLLQKPDPPLHPPFHPAPPDPDPQVVNELLPPELKALSGVQLPKLKVAQVLPTFKLPALPKDLPPLQDLLKSLPPVDPKGATILPGVKLPPSGEVMKVIEGAAGVINSLPKPENLPSLQEVLSAVNTVSNTVNNVIAAKPAGGAAGAGASAAAAAAAPKPVPIQG
jgi:hypothetical protein